MTKMVRNIGYSYDLLGTNNFFIDDIILDSHSDELSLTRCEHD